NLGVLKSITYPTKGKVEFVFEPNTFSYEPNISPEAVEITNFDENYLNWDKISNSIAFNSFSSNNYKYAFTITESTLVNIEIFSSAINQYGWSLNYYKKTGSSYTSIGNYTNAILVDPNSPPASINKTFDPGE